MTYICKHGYGLCFKQERRYTPRCSRPCRKSALTDKSWYVLCPLGAGKILQICQFTQCADGQRRTYELRKEREDYQGKRDEGDTLLSAGDCPKASPGEHYGIRSVCARYKRSRGWLTRDDQRLQSYCNIHGRNNSGAAIPTVIRIAVHQWCAKRRTSDKQRVNQSADARCFAGTLT